MNLDLSDASDESCQYSDKFIDSDLEAELYGQLHHEPNADLPSTPGLFYDQVERLPVQRNVSSNFQHPQFETTTYSRKQVIDVKSSGPKLRRREFKSQGISSKFVESAEHVYGTRKRRCSPFASETCGKYTNLTPEVIVLSDSSPCGKKQYPTSKEIDLSEPSPKLLKKRSSTTAFNVHNTNRKNVRECSPPFERPVKRKKSSAKCEVITVIDSDEVVDVAISGEGVSSDDSVEVLDSNEERNVVVDRGKAADGQIELFSCSEDDDFLADEGNPTDICINLTRSGRYKSFTDLDVEKELQKMPGNPHLWRINEKDRFPRDYRQTFSYRQESRLLKVTCLNCRERGHLSRNCGKPRRSVVCYLCGTSGHEAPKCPRPACAKCMSIGHRVEQCTWKPKNLERKCPICSMKGHLREECPDRWRKYHLTVAIGPIIRNSEIPSSRKKSCFNCGVFGHLGHECFKKKMQNYIHPCLPWVVNYDAPPDFDQRSSQKCEQSKRDRETFLKRLYNKKQKAVECANLKYSRLCKGETGKKKFRQKIGKNKRGKLGGGLNKTYVKNGQLHFPREVGVQGLNFKLKPPSKGQLQRYRQNFRNFHKPVKATGAVS